MSTSQTARAGKEMLEKCKRMEGGSGEVNSAVKKEKTSLGARWGSGWAPCFCGPGLEQPRSFLADPVMKITLSRSQRWNTNGTSRGLRLFIELGSKI